MHTCKVSDLLPVNTQDCLGMSNVMELSMVKQKQPKHAFQSSSNSTCESGSTLSRSKAARFKRVYPEDIDRLPSHLMDECARLKSLHESGTMLTEPICRPLIHSTCIWLLHKGVTNRVDHPDVISKVCIARQIEKLNMLCCVRELLVCVWFGRLAGSSTSNCH